MLFGLLFAVGVLLQLVQNLRILRVLAHDADAFEQGLLVAGLDEALADDVAGGQAQIVDFYDASSSR